MPAFSGCFSTVRFPEVLRILVKTKQTGFLKIKERGQEGFVAVEKGVIIHAKAGTTTALHALFQLVTWKEARFDFEEEPLPAGLSRDLAVYDAEVLIAGVVSKMDLAPENATPPSPRLAA